MTVHKVCVCLREQAGVGVGVPATHHTRSNTPQHAAATEYRCPVAHQGNVVTQQIPAGQSDECQDHTWHRCCSRKLGQ